jgi:histidyl-tRNA synthetase
MILRDTFDRQDVDTRTDCYVVSFDQDSLGEILPLVESLRDLRLPEEGRTFRAEIGNLEASVKSQFRRADRYGARLVLLAGSDELSEGVVSVKRMDTGDQKDLEYTTPEETASRIRERYESVDPAEL